MAATLKIILNTTATWQKTPARNVQDWKEMTSVLEQDFGCLGAGLAYMHEKGIRHKDVKPQNILIYQGAVIYTDFGASRDTTEGLPDFLTRKYSAPEVLDNDKRNFAADISSLGCVFIKMLFALSRPIDNNQVQDQGFSRVIEKLHMELDSGNVPSKLAFLTNIIIFMTMKDPAERPEIKAVARDTCHQEGLVRDKCRPKTRQLHSLTTRSGWTERLDSRKFARCVTPGPLHELTYLRLWAENRD
jgi:serine/threonine protein kinase